MTSISSVKTCESRTASSNARSSISISIVVYRPDLLLLRETCRSLGVALRMAHDGGVLTHAVVDLVDNADDHPADVGPALAEIGADEWLVIRVHRGGGNVGYGRGHNGPLLASDAELHLVLNPDVCLEPEALLAAIKFMQSNPEVGLLTPRVAGPAGEFQRLCRRYPSLFVLYLRGFASAGMRRRFRHRLDEYELADVVGDQEIRGIPLASGCFMLLRRSVAQAVNGFSPEFFLYFEDHDLSLKIARRADIAYVPSVRIIHHGGGASRKGARHVLLFVSSGRRFFSKHGWRLW